jgi:hypothetical protein
LESSSSTATERTTVDAFVRLAWRVTHPAPVIVPPLGSPIVADPTFLLPAETPDGRWHLFAHSVWGVHAFTSGDGVRWTTGALVVRHAMRPFLFRDGDTYHLLYERYPRWRLPLSWMPGLRWRSWIARRASRDLVAWSPEVVVLPATLEWHRNALGEAVGNPCLVATDGGVTLYYSASLVRVPDCGFNEPLHIARATAPGLDGPWRLDPSPLVSPDPRDARCNLGAGAMKVLRLADGWVGLHNGIALDPASGRSRSAISVRRSDDGVAWRYAHDEPIVAPTTGWRRRFVYACDARRESSGRWFLYFNGRDHAAMRRGREAIGFVVGEPAA